MESRTEIASYINDSDSQPWELHTTSALIGGIVAQEAIKLLTNQYIPVQNTIVYNGLNGTMQLFEV